MFVGAHLQPDDTVSGLHGGIIKVPLLLLQVFDPDVHTTFQSLGLVPSHQDKQRHLNLHHIFSPEQVTGFEQLHRVHAVALMELESFSSCYQLCIQPLILDTEPGSSLFMGVHRITPPFRPFWKSGPIPRLLSPSNQLQSSSSFSESHLDRSRRFLTPDKTT